MYTCEGFLLNLKWEDLRLIWISVVGRHTFIQIFNLHLIWATPSAGQHKDVEEGSFYSLLACPHLAGTSIPSLAESLLLQDSIAYRIQTSGLADLETPRFLDSLFIAHRC